MTHQKSIQKLDSFLKKKAISVKIKEEVGKKKELLIKGKSIKK